MPIEPDNDDLADALGRMADGLPDKPQRPAAPPGAKSEFRAPARPAEPDTNASRPAAPTPTPSAKPKPARPDRPDRPDRPTAPPTTQWSEDEAAEVRAAETAEPAEYNPLSEIVDDDAVIVPAPDAEVFSPQARPKPDAAHRSVGVPRSLEFRRTVIPILLTCGVLLIGIGMLKWLGGGESLFSEMSVALCATLCGVGTFLLIVAALNMLQVKGELAAAAVTKPPG